jgi:transposase-like protein
MKKKPAKRVTAAEVARRNEAAIATLARWRTDFDNRLQSTTGGNLQVRYDLNALRSDIRKLTEDVVLLNNLKPQVDVMIAERMAVKQRQLDGLKRRTRAKDFLKALFRPWRWRVVAR